MNLIKETERLLEIAEAEDDMRKRVFRTIENINGFAGTFPELRRKHYHRLEIQRMTRKRLKQIYFKQIEKIKNYELETTRKKSEHQ